MFIQTGHKSWTRSALTTLPFSSPPLPHPLTRPLLLPAPLFSSLFVILARCARQFLFLGALRAPIVISWCASRANSRYLQVFTLLPLATEGLSLVTGKVFIQTVGKSLPPTFEKCSFRRAVHSDGLFIQMGGGGYYTFKGCF